MNKSETQLRTNPRIVPQDLLLKFGYSPDNGIKFDSVASTLSFYQGGTKRVDIGSFGLAVRNGEGLVIGHIAQVNAGLGVLEFEVLGTADADSSMLLGRWGANDQAPTLSFTKSRDPVIADGTFAIVNDGDEIGRLYFTADDGTDLSTPAAQIHVEVDGTPGANDMPGRIIFSTTPDGASVVSEALRIDSLQNLIAPGTLTIGTSGTSDPALIVKGDAQDVTLAFMDEQNGVEGRIGLGIGISGLSNQAFWMRAHNGTHGGPGIAVVPVNGGNLGVYVSRADALGVGVLPSGGLAIVADNTNDDIHFAITNSDVMHALVSQAPTTNVFFSIQKATNTTGGAAIKVYGEDVAALDQVLHFSSFGGQAQTTKTTAAQALVEFDVYEHDGANSLVNITADGNVFAIKAQVGGGLLARFLIDEDGDMWSVTAGTTFDDYDDLALLETYDSVRSGTLKADIKAEFGKVMSMNERTLIEAGVLGAPVAEGGLTNQSQLSRILTGGVRQLGQRHMSLVERVDSLAVELMDAKQQLAALTA